MRFAIKDDESAIELYLEKRSDSAVTLRAIGVDGQRWALMRFDGDRIRTIPYVGKTSGLPTDLAGRIKIESGS